MTENTINSRRLLRGVNNAITNIRSIGKLTNKSRYEYSESDVRRIYLFSRKKLIS